MTAMKREFREEFSTLAHLEMEDWPSLTNASRRARQRALAASGGEFQSTSDIENGVYILRAVWDQDDA